MHFSAFSWHILQKNTHKTEVSSAVNDNHLEEYFVDVNQRE